MFSGGVRAQSSGFVRAIKFAFHSMMFVSLFLTGSLVLNADNIAFAQNACMANVDHGDEPPAPAAPRFPQSVRQEWAPLVSTNCVISNITSIEEPGVAAGAGELKAHMNTNGVLGQKGFGISVGSDFNVDSLTAFVGGSNPGIALANIMLFPTVTTQTSLNITVQISQKAAPNAVFFVTFSKDANSDRLLQSTLMAGPAPIVGPTESELLVSQQSFFTQMVMSQQSSNVISGVGDNLDGLFNNNGQAPFVSLNGFTYQSSGAAKYFARKQKEAAAKKPKTALDILAQHSLVKQNKSSGKMLARKYDTSVNLMAYDQKQKTGSDDHAETLEAAAIDGIHTADIGYLNGENDPSAWNFWVKGSWSRIESHDGSSFEGHMIDVVGGVDYRVNEDLIVGFLTGYGVADFDTMNAGVSGDFEADGIHAGIYMGKRLAPDLLFDALVAYTSSDYDNRAGSTTASFDAHRVTFAAHLKGNIDWGDVNVQPMIGLVFSSERQQAHTDSAAVFHEAKTVNAGRLSIGPKFTFKPVEHDFGQTQVWFAAKGEYDFSNQEKDVNSSLPDLSDIASARIQGGFQAKSNNGFTFSVQGDVGGLGSNEFISYGATAKLSLSF